MGRQRNNPQSKGKKERVLNEIEASTLSDMEFKIMVIRMLNELIENYKELQGSYKELTAGGGRGKGEQWGKIGATVTEQQ